jgi:hypothetical protein
VNGITSVVTEVSDLPGAIPSVVSSVAAFVVVLATVVDALGALVSASALNSGLPVLENR